MSFDSCTDMADLLLTAAVDSTLAIFPRITGSDEFKEFVEELQSIFDRPGHDSKVFFDGIDGQYSTFVFPIREVMTTVARDFQDLVSDLRSRWDEDARQMEISVICLVIREITCPQHVSCFLACLPGKSLYGLRDKLFMMMEFYGETDTDFIPPSQLTALGRGQKRGVFSRFIDSMPFYTVLKHTKLTIFEQ